MRCPRLERACQTISLASSFEPNQFAPLARDLNFAFYIICSALQLRLAEPVFLEPASRPSPSQPAFPYRGHVAGSAAQFNRGVSAMPARVRREIRHLFEAGTADTLLHV